MRLIKLTTSFGYDLWVNPDYILWITERSDSKGSNFSLAGNRNFYSVEEMPETIIQKIEDSLR